MLLKIRTNNSCQSKIGGKKYKSIIENLIQRSTISFGQGVEQTDTNFQQKQPSGPSDKFSIRDSNENSKRFDVNNVLTSGFGIFACSDYTC